MTRGPYPILHLILMKLRPEVDAAYREQIIAGWAALSEVPGVLCLGAVPEAGTGATHHLALFGVMRDVLTMEAFGTDARHMAFLQAHFIPALHSFASADLLLTSPPPPDYGSLFCFLFNTEDGVYEWQVRAAFAALFTGSGATAISAGTAVDHRQRYRAGGILFFTAPEAAANFAESAHFERTRAAHRSVIARDPAFLWGPARTLSSTNKK